MEYIDYYKVLGVERSSSQAEVKKAYRRLARKYHPDVSKEADAEARFKELGEAYEVLKDKEKRAAYDQLGANWKQGQDFRTPPGHDFGGFGNAGAGAGAGFSDFFESVFGGGFSSSGGGGFHPGGGFQQKGANTEASLNISLEQALSGDHLDIQVNGKKLKIKVPVGIKSGQKIRLSKQGQPGVGGGSNGDLLVSIKISPHKIYKLDGKDIELVLPIAPWEAGPGASIEVPLPGGNKVKLKIPAGSDSGKRMRIKGKGLPGKQPGDFYVKLKIIAPKPETEEQQKFYKKMQKVFDLKVR